MKIDPLSPKGQLFQHASKGEGKGRKAVEPTSDFLADLTKNKEKLSLNEMQKLFDKVAEQGARLTKTPTFEELRLYRDLVQRFLSEAVANMYEKQSQPGWDRFGRQKVYTTVRKVNGKLSEMAEDIRNGQANALSIAAQHDAIRGMLVDLYL